MEEKKRAFWNHNSIEPCCDLEDYPSIHKRVWGMFVSTFKRTSYGFYRHSGNPAGDTIVIYNTTAKTGKVVSVKSFADTLLHEFTHHYDTRYLKIDSKHTAGFYKRISSLKSNLTSAKLDTKEIRSDITDLSVRQLIIGVKGNVGG